MGTVNLTRGSPDDDDDVDDDDDDVDDDDDQKTLIFLQNMYIEYIIDNQITLCKIQNCTCRSKTKSD